MIQIRALHDSDYPRVKAIYQQGIDGGNATFITKAKEWAESDHERAKAARLVGLVEGDVVAWACLSDASNNCVYKGLGETTVYVDSAHQGKGIGLSMLEALIEASELAGYWTLQALIFPENTASIYIHEKAGFTALCVHKKLGKHHDVWRDVVLLERRSTVVGQD